MDQSTTSNTHAPGSVWIFEYPAGFVTLPEYSAHRNQRVRVLREMEDGVEYDNPGTCNPREADGTDPIGDRMFEVQAEDGWIGHAWESELAPLPPIPTTPPTALETYIESLFVSGNEFPVDRITLSAQSWAVVKDYLRHGLPLDHDQIEIERIYRSAVAVGRKAYSPLQAALGVQEQ